MRKNEYGRLEMSPLPPVHPAKIVLIGEYPNIEELKKGQYFISTGADALNRTLQKCGVDLDDCYYTVAVPYLMNKKNKVIPAEQFGVQRARIIAEIKESGASIVMPLGTMATSLLYGTKSLTITKVLGNVLTIPELPNVTIVPNYHPALLLHSPGNYKVFNCIVETVANLSKGGTLDPGVTKWKWLNTEAEILQLIDKINQLEYVSADIETSSLNTKEAQVWTFGIATEKNVVSVIGHEMVMKYPTLIRMLFKTKCRWIWHHGKYDTEVWHWKKFMEARLDEDDIYLHYCLNETNGTHGLGKLATIYLGADEYKSKMNSEFANITNYEAYLKYKQDLGERVAIDADYTLQLFKVLSPKVHEKEDLSKLYHHILMPAANFLRKVQMRGIKVDVPYLEKRVPVYESEIEDIVSSVQEAAAPFWDPEVYKAQTGAKSASILFKPTSVKQLAWLIYDKLKLKPTDRAAKKRGTGEEVLESIPNPPEFITRIIRLRKVKKEFSTYVQNYLNMKDENDILHATFNLHIAATGRLSCTDPNIQNVPSKRPDIRNALIARGKDRILLEVDYSGAELRVLAYLSGDKALTNALTNGDPHSEVAAMLFGSDFTKDQRGIAKTVNFGIAYGRGANDLSVTFGVTLQEAQSWIDGWAATYPDAWNYLQSCEEDVRAGRELITIYGRHRRLGLIHDMNIHDLINEAKNFRVQSVSSDNTLLAAMEADDTLENKYDAYIINLIHDSILIDCPADIETVSAVADYMYDIMVNEPMKQFGCTVPFKSDVDMGYRWGTFGAFDRATRTVEYHKETYSYEDWLEYCRKEVS